MLVRQAVAMTVPAECRCSQDNNGNKRDKNLGIPLGHGREHAECVKSEPQEDVPLTPNADNRQYADRHHTRCHNELFE